jgi:hypothetical protein
MRDEAMGAVHQRETLPCENEIEKMDFSHLVGYLLG